MKQIIEISVQVPSKGYTLAIKDVYLDCISQKLIAFVELSVPQRITKSEETNLKTSVSIDTQSNNELAVELVSVGHDSAFWSAKPSTKHNLKKIDGSEAHAIREHFPLIKKRESAYDFSGLFRKNTLKFAASVAAVTAAATYLMSNK